MLIYEGNGGSRRGDFGILQKLRMLYIYYLQMYFTYLKCHLTNVKSIKLI